MRSVFLVDVQLARVQRSLCPLLPARRLVLQARSHDLHRALGAQRAEQIRGGLRAAEQKEKVQVSASDEADLEPHGKLALPMGRATK